VRSQLQVAGKTDRRSAEFTGCTSSEQEVRGTEIPWRGSPRPAHRGHRQPAARARVASFIAAGDGRSRARVQQRVASTTAADGHASPQAVCTSSSVIEKGVGRLVASETARVTPPLRRPKTRDQLGGKWAITFRDAGLTVLQVLDTSINQRGAAPHAGQLLGQHRRDVVGDTLVFGRKAVIIPASGGSLRVRPATLLPDLHRHASLNSSSCLGDLAQHGILCDEHSARMAAGPGDPEGQANACGESCSLKERGPDGGVGALGIMRRRPWDDRGGWIADNGRGVESSIKPADRAVRVARLMNQRISRFRRTSFPAQSAARGVLAFVLITMRGFELHADGRATVASERQGMV